MVSYTRKAHEVERTPLAPLGQRQDIKVPFGEREGRLFPPSHVVRGLGCRCTCPKCGTQLIAKHSSRGLPFFSHHNTKDCPGGYETALHRMAKQIIQDAQAVTLAQRRVRVEITSSEGIKLTDTAEFLPHHSRLYNIRLETRMERWVPDITASLKNDSTIFIEIHVTHAVEGEKPEKLDNLLEIDLSRLSEDTVADMKLLEDAVLRSAPRKWHRCSLYNDLPKVKSIRDDLWRRLENEKNRILKERERRLKEAERESDILSIKESMRQYYSEPLANLATALSPEGVLSRQDELAKDRRYTQAKQWIEIKLNPKAGKLDKIPAIIDVPLNGDWVFNVHRLVWQSFLIFGLVFKQRKGVTFHATKILKEIEKRYGILSWVSTLDKLKRDQKAQGRTRKQWYAGEGAWFLEHEENRAIISPYRVIIEHLSTLSQPHIGILSRIHDTPRFTVQTTSLEEFFYFQEKRIEESTLRMESFLEQQRFEEEAKQFQKEERKKRREERDQEAKSCAAELEAMFYAGASQGSFCRCCRATFTSAVVECNECGKRQIRTLSLIENELNTLYHRVRCSPCVDSQP